MRSAPAGTIRRLHKRARAVLRSVRGAFDLPSILVGVVVVGILTAGVLASVFGVIPFAQDNGAKQDLSAVRTAEGVAKARDGRFLDAAGLDTAGYVSRPLAAAEGDPSGIVRVADVSSQKPLAVQTDAGGSCYVSVVVSPTGNLFAGTSTRPDPFSVTSSADVPECLDATTMAALFAALPAHTAAASAPTTGGSLAVWGSYQHGEVGINASPYTSNGSTSVPVNAASSLTGQPISELDSGTKPCVLVSGSVSCWGFNATGSTFYTGTGSSATSVYAPQPLATDGGMANKAVTKFSSGSGASCAIENGNLYCWGTTNGWGGISGSTSSTRWPVAAWPGDPVLQGKKFSDVTVGTDNVCAISSGKAYCWGDVRFGANGAGTTTQPYSSQNWTSPAAVVDTGVLKGRTVTALSIGAHHTCAIADAAVFCWGNNNYGQLGTGNLNESSVPVAVDTSGVLAGKKITAVTAGVYSTCVVADGAAYCWGQNSNGTLGNGSTAVSNVPVAVSTAGVLASKTVSNISTNGNTTCALSDGAAYCWGLNTFGNLGNGSTATSTTPVAVDTSGALKGKKLIGISVGNSATFALIA